MSTENLTLRVPLRWTSVEIFLVVSCFRNREKRRPDGPFGSYRDLFVCRKSNRFHVIIRLFRSRLDNQPLFGKGARVPFPGVTQTRNERATEIEPSSEVDHRRLKNVLRTLVKHSVTASRVTLFLLLF